MVGHSPEASLAERDDSGNQSLDRTFDLLTDQRRRYVLTCLAEKTQPIALTDLAEDVAVRENEGPITEIPDEAVRSIKISLYHIHIPKLAEAGAVEYDRDRDLVRISETADLVERGLFLTADDGEER